MKFGVVLPILEFENEKSFKLEEINNVFYKLGENVNFTLINSFKIRDDFEISGNEQNLLKLSEKKPFNIVTVNEPFENSTINFSAPLVFNLEDKIMGQVIFLDKFNYSLAEEGDKKFF